MRHHHRAYHPGGHAPTGRMGVLLLVAAPRIREVVGAAEVLPEVMRGAHLQRLAVHHHALDRGRVLGTGTLLALRFAAGEDRDRAPLLVDPAVAREHSRYFLRRLRRGVVDRVSLSPDVL